MPRYEISAFDPRLGRLRTVAISLADETVSEPVAFARVQALQSYSNPRERPWFPDAVHLSVKRATEQTVCSWPSDWETFASPGSMTLPPTSDVRADLGIIKSKGSRLTDIQRVLRKYRHLLRLNGQSVLVKLVMTLPHEKEAH